MLTRRIIPCLDVKDGRVVKGVQFVELRDAGDPVEAAEAYDAQGADELTFLDITASHEKRGIILDVVARTAERVFMPLTVGGGVREIADIRNLLNAGKPPNASAASASWLPSMRAGCPAATRPPGRSTPTAAGIRPASTPSRGPNAWSATAPARSC